MVLNAYDILRQSTNLTMFLRADHLEQLTRADKV